MGADDWAAIRPNLRSVAEASDWWDILHGHVEAKAAAEDRELLAAAAAALDELDWSGAPWAQLVALLKERTGRAGKPLFLPLRRALTGRDSGPEMATLLPLIGREEAASRLAAAL
jgi:glutamyl-tRNA synthetase